MTKSADMDIVKSQGSTKLLERKGYTMTKQEAERQVRAYDENDGPETYEEAAELFLAIYGREPDADDGDRYMIFSHVCAAVS